MGNHKFKLSNMMPNAWFYKLRDMSKSKNLNTQIKKLSTPPKKPRKSYYHPTQSRLLTHNNYSNSPNNPNNTNTFPYEHPQKSSKKRAKRKTIYTPSPTRKTRDNIFQNVQNTPVSVKPKNSLSYDSESDGLSSSCAADIVIEVDSVSYGSINIDKLTEFNMVSEPDDVKEPTKNYTSTKKVKTGHRARKSVSRPRGVKVKIRADHGPKTASRKMEKNRGGHQRIYSESLAIVKASIDPERDFRESMMEMVIENNIRTSKELEDLLACYLSLNSSHYHGLIIKAFEHIWFNMPS